MLLFFCKQFNHGLSMFRNFDDIEIITVMWLQFKWSIHNTISTAVYFLIPLCYINCLIAVEVTLEMAQHYHNPDLAINN